MTREELRERIAGDMALMMEAFDQADYVLRYAEQVREACAAEIDTTEMPGRLLAAHIREMPLPEPR